MSLSLFLRLLFMLLWHSVLPCITFCYPVLSLYCYLLHSQTKQLVTIYMVWFSCLQENSNNFGIAGLALFQWGWCGANVYLKVLGSAATSGPRGVVSLGVISPASREAESPSQLLSLIPIGKSMKLRKGMLCLIWLLMVFTLTSSQ